MYINAQVMWAMKQAFFLPRACIVLNKWKCTQLLEGVIPTVTPSPLGSLCVYTLCSFTGHVNKYRPLKVYVQCMRECACVCISYTIQYNI